MGQPCMNKTAVISQSNYIPWKGYFDLINKADVFVLLDDVQYTRRDWRNRNKIKTPDGLKWLTIPVSVKGSFHQKIQDVRVSDRSWVEKHWKSIVQNYRSADHFDTIKGVLQPLYDDCLEIDRLSRINFLFISAICNFLAINTETIWSSEFAYHEDPSLRLLLICESLGVQTYLTGPAAKDYLREDLFHEKQISVEYFDYSGYPEYPQLHGSFEHAVSVIDLLFCAGPDARNYMKTFSSSKDG